MSGFDGNGQATLLKARMSLALVAGAIAASCEGAADPGTVPVKSRGGGPAKTLSMKPVETLLYRYKGNRLYTPGAYQIVDEPPLRFRFPAAYYYNNVNVAGGPQIAIDLVIDRSNFQPFRIAYKRLAHLPEPERYARRFALEMPVTIDSNLATDIGNPRRYFSRQRYRNSDIPKDPTGRIGNFAVYSFSQRPGLTPPPPSLIINGIELGQLDAIAFPRPYDSEPVKMIRCRMLASRCQFFMVYKGRYVRSYIEKDRLLELPNLSRKLQTFINKFDASVERN